jgi:ribose transport system substrate-binding protein
MTMRPRIRAATLATSIAAAALLLLSACGSDGGSSADTSIGASSEAGIPSDGGSSADTSSGGSGEAGVSYAKDQLAAAAAAPSFEAPGPEFDVTGVEGKSIFVIPAASNEFDNGIQSQMEAIAKKYGVAYKNYANQGTPNEWVTGFNAALSQDPDLIILNTALDPNQVKAQMEQAKEKGIPVLATHFYDDETSKALGTTCGGSQDLCDIGLSGSVSAPFNRAMRLAADYVIADSNGEGEALIISANDAAPSVGMVEAAEGEFTEYCPGCKVTAKNVSIADWATKIQPLVQAELARNPNLKYIIPIFDYGSSFVESGINAAGKKGQVQIASYNGTENVLTTMANGGATTLDVGESVGWLGYAFMDQAFRLMTGQPTVDQNTPIRVWSPDNIAEAGDPPSAANGYGDAYVGGYESLWKAGS